MADHSDIVVEHSSTATPRDDGGTVIKHQTAIRDRKAGRSWWGEGETLSVASTKAARKMLGDRRAREYVG